MEKSQRADGSSKPSSGGRPANPLTSVSPVDSERTLFELPEQLSPGILSVLLDGLIEYIAQYNGVTFRDVPLRTFRGKYVGLYFGSVDGLACRNFVDRLRAF